MNRPAQQRAFGVAAGLPEQDLGHHGIAGAGGAGKGEFHGDLLGSGGQTKRPGCRASRAVVIDVASLGLAAQSNGGPGGASGRFTLFRRMTGRHGTVRPVTGSVGSTGLIGTRARTMGLQG